MQHGRRKRHGEEQHRMADASNNVTEKKGDWSWEHGRIDRIMIERHLSKEEIDNAIFYICEPTAMINALKEDVLQNQLRIPKDRIKVEEFTGY